MENIDKVQTIDAYINQFDGVQKVKLQEFNQIITSSFPKLKSKIAWNMLSFYNRKIIISFAAHKHHLGLYPGPEVISFYSKRLEKYLITKGSIHLPYDHTIDVDLIKDIIFYNLEHEEKK